MVVLRGFRYVMCVAFITELRIVLFLVQTVRVISSESGVPTLLVSHPRIPFAGKM